MITYNFMRMIAILMGFSPTTAGSEIRSHHSWTDYIFPVFDNNRAGYLIIYMNTTGTGSGTEAKVDDIMCKPSTHYSGPPAHDDMDWTMTGAKLHVSHAIIATTVTNGVALLEVNSKWKAVNAQFITDEIGLFYYHNASDYTYILAHKIPTAQITVTSNKYITLKFGFSASSGLTANFLRMLESCYGGVACTFKKVDGSTYSFNFITPTTTGDNHQTGGYVTAIAGDTSYGIIVGSGQNVYNGDNYCLNSQLTTLTHGAVTFVDCGYVAAGDNAYLILSRLFTNNTSSEITIREIGIRIKGDPSPATPFLIYYQPVSDIVLKPGEYVNIIVKIKSVIDAFTVELFAANQIYQLKNEFNFITKLVNSNTYSMVDRVENKLDGGKIFLIGGKCYEESTSKETGKMVSGYISGKGTTKRLYGTKAMTVTPILIGDKVTGSPLDGNAITLTPFQKRALKQCKADMLQLKIVPSNDFNTLLVEDIPQGENK